MGANDIGYLTHNCKRMPLPVQLVRGNLVEPSFEAWQLSCTSTAAWCLGNNCTSWPHNAAPSSSSSRDILGDTATSWIDSVKKSLLCKIAWIEGLMCEHETMQPYYYREGTQGEVGFV